MYCTDSDYGITDNLTVLLPGNDAATFNWGADWRMPTKEEWQELLENTVCQWTMQNGVWGQLFTAENGNSVFLPAAGYRVDDCFEGWWPNLIDNCGGYWSSSLDTENPFKAWGVYFNSGNFAIDNYYRYCGLSVRAVCTLPQGNAPTGAINGLFSVSNTQQVFFSKGNLQYRLYDPNFKKKHSERAKTGNLQYRFDDYYEDTWRFQQLYFADLHWLDRFVRLGNW